MYTVHWCTSNEQAAEMGMKSTAWEEEAASSVSKQFPAPALLIGRGISTGAELLGKGAGLLERRTSEELIEKSHWVPDKAAKCCQSQAGGVLRTSTRMTLGRIESARTHEHPP